MRVTGEAVELTFVAANLGRGVTTRVFRTQLVRVLSAGGDVVGLLEIDEGDQAEERAVLERWRDRYVMAGLATHAPVLVDRRLSVVRRRVTHAAPGLARLTPARHVTEVVFTVPGAEWLGELVFLVTHVPIDRPATRTRRAAVRAALRVRSLTHQARGRSVVWVADTNTRERWPRWLRRERVLFRQHPDEGRLAPAPGVRARLTGGRVIGLDIDRHDGHAVTVRFTRKRRPGRSGKA